MTVCISFPSYSKLRANHCCCVIAQPCFVEAAHKGQIKGKAKTIRVPRGKNDKIRRKPYDMSWLNLVEPGVRIVG